MGWPDWKNKAEQVDQLKQKTQKKDYEFIDFKFTKNLKII